MSDGSNINLELPVNLKDLFNFTFNFDNLIRTLNYFHSNNVSLYSEFKDIDKRVSLLETLKSEIEELKIKSKNIENMHDNFNRSFISMQERLINIELRVSEASRKSDEASENLKANKIVMENYTKNMSNINSEIDDHMKKINLLNKDFEDSKINTANIETELNELSKETKMFKENSSAMFEQMKGEIQQTLKDINSTNINVTTITNNFMDFKDLIETKNIEYDTTLANLVKQANEQKNGSDKKNNKNKNTMGNIGNINGENFERDNAKLNNLLNEIEKNTKNYEKIIENLKAENEKMLKDNENTKQTVENISNSFEELQKNFENLSNQFTTEKNKMYHISNLANLDFNNFATVDMIKKISDSIKILNSTVTTKTNRDEMELVIKKINSRLETIEMIQQGKTSGPRTMINNNLVQDNFSEETSSIMNNEQQMFELLTQKKGDKDKKYNDLKNGILNIMNEEIKNLDFSKNEKFAEMVQNLHIQQVQITENSEKIKNILIKNELPSIMDEIARIRDEINKLYDENKDNRINISKILIDLRGGDEQGNEELDDKNYDNFSGTISSKITFLLNNYNKVYDKVVSMETKVNSMSKTMKEEVKQSLKNDTVSVVNDFRNRLESFSNRFEDELKNKIDQIGLNTFENKLNSKLHYDLKDKLDKNELRKNNNVIKRKIDTLENKISKTLVDTIIDLQMDDAPLLLKKNSLNMELCASCNQPIQKTNYVSSEYIPPTVMNKNKSFRSGPNTRNYNVNNSMNKTGRDFGKKLPNISSYQSK